MSQLEVRIYKSGNQTPENQITMPLSVLRLNPKLLPAQIAKVLDGQGISVSELASLEGVEGTILDISGSSSRIVVAINNSDSSAKIEEPQPVALEIPIQASAETVPVQQEKPARPSEPRKNLSPFQQRLSTEFIAKEIGWRTGHDLIYAACAHMHMVQGRKEWSSDEIDDEIRSASNYYKPFYSTNLKEYLQYLMKNSKLFLNDSSKYELTPATVKYLEDRLSEEKLKKRF